MAKAPFDLDYFDRQFANLLVTAKEEAASREGSRTLLYDRVKELQDIGFGVLRLPRRDGGGGFTLRQFFDKLITLAAADSNLAHVYRGHIAFVEGILLERNGKRRQEWLQRFIDGDFVGNAQSERQEIAEIKTELTQRGDRVFLDGVKYYTTGSIYADWIHLVALEKGERVGVTVSTRHAGVRSIDDWDGFGQQLTGSGTTVFKHVPVEADEIKRSSGKQEPRGRYTTSIFQLCLLAVVAGIAEAALSDTCEYVRPRRRIFGFMGETLPRENPLVQAVVGDLASAAHAARSLVLASAQELDAVFAAARRTPTGAEDALVAAELNVFKAQQIVLSLVLSETTQLFEVGGASAVGKKFGLDRHWRNARTLASHNPAVQRKRAIGDYALNGRAPNWGKRAEEDQQPPEDGQGPAEDQLTPPEDQHAPLEEKQGPAQAQKTQKTAVGAKGRRTREDEH